MAKGEGRCVDFDQAPRYLRREFILSGYYVGEPSECPVPAPRWREGTGSARRPRAGLPVSCKRESPRGPRTRCRTLRRRDVARG